MANDTKWSSQLKMFCSILRVSSELNCSYNDLCITNTFFASKATTSVRHRTKRCHQLDFVITRRPMLNYVLLMPSYHSADFDIDHFLVGSKVHLCHRQILLEAAAQQRGQIVCARIKWMFCQSTRRGFRWLPHEMCLAMRNYIRDAMYKVAIANLRNRVKTTRTRFAVACSIYKWSRSLMCHGSSNREGVEQPHSNTQHQDEGVPSMRVEHYSLWQWDLDPMLSPRVLSRALMLYPLRSLTFQVDMLMWFSAL